MAPNLTKKVFVIHLAYFGDKIILHPTFEIQIALLTVEKVIVPIKYLDFANFFSKKLATEVIKCFNINKYLIDLELDK